MQTRAQRVFSDKARALQKGPRADPSLEGCLHHLAEKAARSFPDAPAIVHQGKILRYRDLMRGARRIASRLQQQGVGAGSIVALDLPRSPDLIMAQLAVLEVGGAYMCLDRTSPVERSRFMLADARPTLMVTTGAPVEDLDSPCAVLRLDESESVGRGGRFAGASLSGIRPEHDDVATLPPVSPDSPAYVVYTSGSTGQPKGVLTAHRGPLNFIAHMIAARRLRHGERVLQFTSLSFDGAVRDTIGTLAFGGTIVLLGDEDARDPRALRIALRDQKVDAILSIVPTMLRALIREELKGNSKDRTLRLIMVAGETLLSADVDEARRAFGPDVQIVNQWGATECSMVTTDYPVPSDLPAGAASLSIGKPIPNTHVHILDENFEPVPPGGVGELYIAGVGVSLGYLNRPELTAERFLSDPHESGGMRMYRTGDLGRLLPDGNLAYQGRGDHQVKIRGHRVELGEIEGILRRHPSVTEAAVVSWGEDGQKRLAAYVALEREVRAGVLRELLAAHLPFSVLPSSVVVLERLPRTPNGKIDRERLPNPVHPGSSRSFLPPHNSIEERLVSLWESLIGVTPIGVEDDFFELGGDSLMAARLFEAIEREFDRVLPLQVLFQNATVAALATLLARDGAPARSGVVSLQPHGASAPLFLVSSYLYLRELALSFAPNRPVFGLETQTPYGSPIEEEALVHYRNLVSFRPHGPYQLLGHSAGGYVALEIARLLIRDGKDVPFLGLIDTFPPGRRHQAAVRERMRIHGNNLRGKTVREAGLYLSESARRFALRTLGSLAGSRRLLGVVAKRGAGPWVQRLNIQTYAPPPYVGSVTLFSVRERPVYVRRDPMRPWRRYVTGPLEIVPVEGDHLSAVRQPRARALARIIESRMP